MNIAPFPRCSCAFNSPCIRLSVCCNEKTIANRRMTNAPIWCRHIPLKFNMQSQCNVMWTAVAPVVPHILRMVQFRWSTPRCSSLQWKLWQLVWKRRWKSSFFVITTGLCQWQVLFRCFFSTENSENWVHPLKLPCLETLSGSPIQKYLNIWSID